MAEILYTTVDGEYSFELEEKRSVFIGYAKEVKNQEQAKEFIQSVKAKHHDARHNCSAYLLKDGVMRYSDDSEPQGTAGIPILEVIKKSGLSDVAVVVTRYFGGILLGAGGLVRAYSAAASGVLSKAQKASYQSCCEFTLSVDYQQYDKLIRLLENANVRIINTDYSENIAITAVITQSEYKALNDIVREAFGGKIELLFLKDTIEKLSME